MEDMDYRGCVNKTQGNCPYVRRNEYGTYICGIDHICQVEFYGCRPSEIKKFKKLKEELINGS
jgi:hypothetical protein